MRITEKDVRETVAEAAVMLDEKLPGWAEKIDLSALHMNDCSKCVLGQAGADLVKDTGYDDGFSLLYERLQAQVPRLGPWHPFCSSGPLNGGWEGSEVVSGYEDEWAKQIEKRCMDIGEEGKPYRIPVKKPAKVPVERPQEVPRKAPATPEKAPEKTPVKKP